MQILKCQIMKSIDSFGENVYQYQQNEQLPITPNHWTQKIPSLMEMNFKILGWDMYYTVAVLQPVNGIPTFPLWIKTFTNSRPLKNVTRCICINVVNLWICFCFVLMVTGIFSAFTLYMSANLYRITIFPL